MPRTRSGSSTVPRPTTNPARAGGRASVRKARTPATSTISTRVPMRGPFPDISVKTQYIDVIEWSLSGRALVALPATDIRRSVPDETHPDGTVCAHDSHLQPEIVEPDTDIEV